MKQIIFLIALLMATTSHAGWPTFHVLTGNKVLQQLITTDGCPAGEGRIPEGSKILIETTGHVKHNRWYWIVDPHFTGCQPLPEDLTYNHFTQAGGHYTGGEIAIGYGEPQGKSVFQLLFIIENTWDCSPFGTDKLPTIIGCAQDTN